MEKIYTIELKDGTKVTFTDFTECFMFARENSDNIAHASMTGYTQEYTETE